MAGALAFLGMAGPAEQLGLGELLEGARIKVWASRRLLHLTARTTTYRRNAARVAAAVELKYSAGLMKPHSLNAEPLVRARR